MNVVIEVVCCACDADSDSDTVTSASLIAAGWVLTRGVWTCPECADEARQEMQADYDAAWPTPLELGGGYGS